MAQDKKCIVCYKTGWLSGRICYGKQFDELQPCCDTFMKVFCSTGNIKSNIWGRGDLHNARPDGLNLVIYHGGLEIMLFGKIISFCPWCGSGIEIKQSKDVTLAPKTREVPGGLEESEVRIIV